jgi:Carboxypeptidase regulatory-like domain
VGPPAQKPPGGLTCVRAMLFVFAVCAFAPAQLRAQFIRGTIRAQGTEGVVPGASIVAEDSVGKQVAGATSDDKGHFTLPLAGGHAFKVTVKKIGWQPSSTDLIHASPADTLDMDLLVPMETVVLPGVSIKGSKETRNQRSYEEAKRLGWKVYEPADIESHRQEFTNFEVMMRALQVTGVRMPASSTDCYVNLRNGRCFTFIVDGEPVGPMWLVNPVDVYFMAILQPSESVVHFGDQAPWGAILIVTRMNGDKLNP